MANTPNFSLPYPALSDPPDGPGQIQALAQAIDTVMPLRAVSSLSVVTSPAANQIVLLLTDLRMYRFNASTSGWAPITPGMPACVVQNDTAVAIAPGPPQVVDMTGAIKNPPVGGTAMWDIANPARITIREDGTYVTGVRSQWSADLTGYRLLGITKNNSVGGFTRSSSVAYTTMPSSTNATEGNGQLAIGVDNFVVGDILRVNAGHTSNATRWLEGGTSGNNAGGTTKFWAYKISD